MPQIQPRNKSQSGESSKKFLEFIMMQAQQIYFMLGLIPSPMSGRAEVNLKGAKVYMEFLGVIKEKTRGNLTKEESASLLGILHELQMAYAETAAAMGEIDAELPHFVDDEELMALEQDDQLPPAPAATAAPASRREETRYEEPPAKPVAPTVQESRPERERESKKKFVKSYGP